jgi:hypothetical protein
LNYPHSTPKLAAPSPLSKLSKVIVLANAEVKLKHSGTVISASPVAEMMLKALKGAILSHHPELDLEVLTPAMVHYHSFEGDQQTLLCPLTIDLPDQVEFAGRAVFEACRDIQARRQWVQQQTNHRICDQNQLGDRWLPIIYTAQGPLYCEVIGEGEMPNSYHQPTNLDDAQRRSLHRLGDQLLESIDATPSVYLLQFSVSAAKEIIFDRLWPFPAAPAIASITAQQPDLFTCHWRCITNQSIPNIMIT